MNHSYVGISPRLRAVVAGLLVASLPLDAGAAPARATAAKSTAATTPAAEPAAAAESAATPSAAAPPAAAPSDPVVPKVEPHASQPSAPPGVAPPPPSQQPQQAYAPYAPPPPASPPPPQVTAWGTPHAAPPPPPMPRKRTGSGMMIAGWTVLGSVWLTCALVGAVSFDEAKDAQSNIDDARLLAYGQRMMIPIGGPWAALGVAPSATAALFTALAGVAQSAGLALGIAGGVIYGRHRRVRPSAFATPQGAALRLEF